MWTRLNEWQAQPVYGLVLRGIWLGLAVIFLCLYWRAGEVGRYQINPDNPQLCLDTRTGEMQYVWLITQTKSGKVLRLRTDPANPVIERE